jgi:hypothetical protein
MAASPPESRYRLSAFGSSLCAKSLREQLRKAVLYSITSSEFFDNLFGVSRTGRVCHRQGSFELDGS